MKNDKHSILLYAFSIFKTYFSIVSGKIVCKFDSRIVAGASLSLQPAVRRDLP